MWPFDVASITASGDKSTAAAAQPIAAQGMLVLQIGDGDYTTQAQHLMTPGEAPHAVAQIEAAEDFTNEI